MNPGASMDDSENKNGRLQKHQKISMDGNPWMDLPQEILELFLEKLPFVADQIRFRSVCKNWCIPKHLVKWSHDNLAWMVSFQVNSPLLKIFDPHKKESYTVSTVWPTDDTFMLYGSSRSYYGKDTQVYASKNGWLLRGTSKSLFLHNPLQNIVFILPPLTDSNFLAATFTENPESPACEILVLSCPPRSTYLYIDRHCLSTDTGWDTQYLQKLAKFESIHISTHYMNGKLYCLMKLRPTGGVNQYTLMCYNLADKSWNSHTVKVPAHVSHYMGHAHWLTGKGGSLVLVACGHNANFTVLSYDWSTMCWAETDMDGTSFFISGKAIISATSAMNTDKGCRVFYVGYAVQVVYSYSLREKKRVLAVPLYLPKESMEEQIKGLSFKRCFIEHPYFRNS